MTTVRNIFLVAIVSLIIGSATTRLPAHERLADGTIVEFVTSTSFSTATTNIVFTRRADGTVIGPGNCAPGGPLQSVVAIDPGSGGSVSSFNVIVVLVDGVENPAEVPPGTRLGPPTVLGTCGTNGEYTKVRAVVQ